MSGSRARVNFVFQVIRVNKLKNQIKPNCQYSLQTNMQVQILSILILAAVAVSIKAANPHEKSVNQVQQLLKPSFASVSSPSQVDARRQRYLALEIDLWHLIDSGIDSAYVLEQIHDVHLRFFSEHFGELNVTFNDYAIDRQTQLFRAVGDINRTVSMVIKNSLRQNPLAFDEKATINTAQLQLDLTHQINTIVSITGSSDFYTTIKNVSEF